MEPSNTTQIVTAVISLFAGLFSVKGWDFWKHRMSTKAKQEILEIEDKNLYRDDLRVEVQRLRKEYKDLQDRRDTEVQCLREEISDLRAQVAKLSTQVEFLVKENKMLRKG